MNLEQMHTDSTKFNRYSKVLFILWVYTLVVILWGAWVRISHSGDGCGDHWPLCGGQFIPEFNHKKTWVEYTHRLMSGVYGLIVLFIYFKIRSLKPDSMIKKINLFLLLLMISEALLGAALVKGQLVTVDDSIARLIVMSFHQINSFLLTGVTYLFYVSLKQAPSRMTMSSKSWFFIFLILPLTGAIAALSTTLFPSISLWQGILQDFSHQEHPFIRLRVLHPFLALLICSGIIIWCYLKNHSRLAIEFTIAIFIGIITLVTLSPVYLKLLHLGFAHYLWSRYLNQFSRFKQTI